MHGIFLVCARYLFCKMYGLYEYEFTVCGERENASSRKDARFESIHITGLASFTVRKSIRPDGPVTERAW